MHREPKPRRYGKRKKYRRRSEREVLTTGTIQAIEKTKAKWEPLLTRALTEKTLEGQIRILAGLYKISATAGKGVWSVLLTRWAQKTGAYLAEEAYAEFMRRKTTGKKKT